MAKKRQGASTQQQRRAARARHDQEQLETDELDAADSSKSARSYIVLRSTLPSGSFVPAVCLQVFAVAYSLVLLHGRPTSLSSVSALLAPLIYNTKSALVKTIAGVLAVQLYSAVQLKLWYARSQTSDVPKKSAASDTIQPVESPAVTEETCIPSAVNSWYSRLPLVDLKNLDLPSIPETLLGVLLSAVTIFIMTILLGAPIARLLPETALFSCYLATLALLPSMHVLRSPFSLKAAEKVAVRVQWSRLFASFRPRSDVEIALLLPAYGAIIGSMVGVIPEGLDWEEPWQKWPVPCLLSSFIGLTLGHIATLAMCSILWLARAGSQKRLARGEAVTVS